MELFYVLELFSIYINEVDDQNEEINVIFMSFIEVWIFIFTSS